MADAPRQVFAPVRLAQQLDARLQAAALHDGVLRVARGKQHGQLRQQQPGLARQFRAGDLARHHHIRKQQIDGDAAAKDGQRAFAIAGAQHDVTQAAQHVHHRRLHLHVVFHDEYGFLATEHGAAQLQRQFRFRFERARQVDAEGAAMAGHAVHRQVAAALAQEAVRHGQAQARAFAFLLRREEWFENLVQQVGGNARACIRDGQLHVVAGRHVRMARRIVAVQHAVAQFDGQLALAIHGVARVDGQVEDDVFQLVRVDQGAPAIVGQQQTRLDAFSRGAPQQLFRRTQQLRQVRHQRFQWLTPRKGQQLGRQLGAPFHGGRGAGDAPGCQRVAVQAQLQQLQIAGDNLQYVIEIMGHAARQLAQRLEFL